MSWLEYNKKINKTLKGPKPVPKESQKLAVVPPNQDEGRENRLYDVKKRVHHCLLERLDLSQLEELDEKLRAKEIRQAISTLLEEEKEPLNMRERARLAREMEFEILGLGPLEPLLLDPAISDILVNRYNQVYVERKGCLELTEVRFQDNDHLLKIINKIVSNVGRRIDESVPMVDAAAAGRLPGQRDYFPAGLRWPHAFDPPVFRPTPHPGGFNRKRQPHCGDRRNPQGHRRQQVKRAHFRRDWRREDHPA